MRDPDCTEYDERLTQINDAMSGLLTRKNELIQAGCTDTGYNSRVRAIADTLEGTSSAIEAFDDGIVSQTVSNIKVLDKDRLSVQFKDGTEIEQEIISMRRANAQKDGPERRCSGPKWRRIKKKKLSSLAYFIIAAFRYESLHTDVTETTNFFNFPVFTKSLQDFKEKLVNISGVMSK